jgi:hypothetical protein
MKRICQKYFSASRLASHCFSSKGVSCGDIQLRPSLSIDSHIIEGVDLLGDVSTGVFRTVVGRTPLATTLNSKSTALVFLPEDLLLSNFRWRAGHGFLSSFQGLPHSGRPLLSLSLSNCKNVETPTLKKPEKIPCKIWSQPKKS